jgi:glucose/mannose transport system substrate-binding protein
MGRLGHFAAAVALGAALATSASAATLVIHQDMTAPGELKAINDLKTLWEQGGDHWSDLTIPHDSGATVTLGSLIAGGNPPDIFFSPEPGLYADLKRQGMDFDLKDYFNTPKGKAAYDGMPEFLHQVIALNGEMLRAPNSLHVDGMICYNLTVAKDAGVDPSSWKSFDDFYADFDKIKGKGYIPLAFGADNFQIGYLFHTLAADFAGDIYDRVFGAKPDRTALDTPQMRAVFDNLRKIQQHTDPGAPGRQWNEATNMVITGKALMQIQGDWMTGEWRAAGKEQGKDYSCMTYPGAKGIAMTVNVWGLVNSHSDAKKEAQYRFLDSNFDPALQVQFALDKGSTPPRLDVDSSKLPPWTQSVLQMLKQPGFVHPTPQLTIDQDWKGGIWNVAAKFWADPNMNDDAAIKALQQAYDQVFS